MTKTQLNDDSIEIFKRLFLIFWCKGTHRKIRGPCKFCSPYPKAYLCKLSEFSAAPLHQIVQQKDQLIYYSKILKNEEDSAERRFNEGARLDLVQTGE